SQPALLTRAQQLLDGLEHGAPDGRRLVIDGISARTEFKGAYCVPNSLALVLGYWGVPVTSKAIGAEITALDQGTTAADALWYVHRQGLDPWIVPLAATSELPRLLDQGLPLLLYLPQHMLAAVGYDDAMNSLVTYDVAEADIWVDHPLEELVPQWKKE